MPEKIFIEKINPKHNGVGWKSRLQKKRASYFITLSKTVVTGSGLGRGDELYSYLCEDDSGRSIIVSYLDGKPRKKQNESEKS